MVKNPKFNAGNIVKYVDKDGYRNPPHGAIGKVKNIGAAGFDFLVDFGVTTNDTYWCSESELELVEVN